MATHRTRPANGLVAGLILVFLGAQAVFSTSAAGQDERVTVSDLLHGCEGLLAIRGQDGATLEEASDWGRCLGFVRGVTAVLVYACWSRSEGYMPMMASGSPPSTEASIQAFVNWARENPDLWAENAEDGVIPSIMTVWPCE